MGIFAVTREAVDELKNQGHYRFVAIFKWKGEDDEVAAARLGLLTGHELFGQMGIDPKTCQTYYLTGARTQLIIGYAKSGEGLKTLHSVICLGTGIEAEFYHAVTGQGAARASAAASKIIAQAAKKQTAKRVKK